MTMENYIVFTRGPARPDEYPIYLTAWREHRHLTQRELAHQSGVALTSINEIETGKRTPRVSTLRRLASALEIDDWQLHNHPRDEEAVPPRFVRELDRLEQTISTLQITGMRGSDFARFLVHWSDWVGEEKGAQAGEDVWTTLGWLTLPWLFDCFHELTVIQLEHADPLTRAQITHALKNWQPEWERAGLPPIAEEVLL